MKLLHCAAFAAVSFFIAHQVSAAELCREISVSYTSGDIDGHLQAPYEGVNSNLVGPSRQSFSELGYDGFHQWNIKGSYDYGQNRFYIHYDRTRLDKDVELPVPPISLAPVNISEMPQPAFDFSIDAGFIADPGFTAVDREFTVPYNFSSQLDLYRLGYQRLFELEFIGRQLILAPGVELAILDFDYRQNLDTSRVPVAQPADIVAIINADLIDAASFHDIFDGLNGTAFFIAFPTDIDRSYTKTGLRIGGEAEYQLSERFSLTAELYDSIPVDDWPEIFTAKLGLRVKLFEGGHTAVYLHGSLGRETLEYEDEDSFSDDVRAEYRDMFEGGISVRF